MNVIVAIAVLLAISLLLLMRPKRPKHRRARSFHYNVGPSRAKRGD